MMHSSGKIQAHSQRRQKDNFIASCYTTNLADCGSVCCSFRIKLCNDTGSPKEDIEMQTVYVPAGQRTLVTLADGTTVWVNGKVH